MSLPVYWVENLMVTTLKLDGVALLLEDTSNGTLPLIKICTIRKHCSFGLKKYLLTVSTLLCPPPEKLSDPDMRRQIPPVLRHVCMRESSRSEISPKLGNPSPLKCPI